MRDWLKALGITVASMSPLGLIFLMLLPVPTHTMAVNPSPYDVPAYRQAFFDASRIYGKAGCGDITLAEMTAENSLRTGVPANIIAAIISVESSCNPLAISNRGAVGLTQVNVKVQSEKFEQFSAINLFNPKENMRVGTQIMSEMIKQYGLRSGISHYDGVGPEADAYVLKVLALAGK
jgi:hypothetical protein